MLNVNEIYNGDCLELMKLIPDKSINLICCDLPYGTTSAKWDSIIDMEKLWEQYKRIIKDGGAIVLTASQPFSSALVMSNPKWFKAEWLWEKPQGTNFQNAKYHPLRIHETVLVFGKGTITYNPQMKTGYSPRPATAKKQVKRIIETLGAKSSCANNTLRYGSPNGERYPTTILKFPYDKQRGFHPTQKPIALWEYLIKTYSNEGDTVLDNCAGSFTTALACENTGRNWICIEQEEKYCEIGKQRLEENKKSRLVA